MTRVAHDPHGDHDPHAGNPRAIMDKKDHICVIKQLQWDRYLEMGTRKIFIERNIS